MGTRRDVAQPATLTPEPAAIAECLLAQAECLRLQVEVRLHDEYQPSRERSLAIRDLSPLGR